VVLAEVLAARDQEAAGTAGGIADHVLGLGRDQLDHGRDDVPGRAELAVLAGRKGQAVGICHPYPQTLEALRREAPYLKQQGIEIVPVSQLLVR